MKRKIEDLSPDQTILSQSSVYRITKDKIVYLALIWEYSYEQDLLRANGWLCEETGIETKTFVKLKGLKLLSTPFWVCDCPKKYLRNSLNKKVCPLCSGHYTSRLREDFRTIKQQFGWENVSLFIPKDAGDDEVLEDDDED